RIGPMPHGKNFLSMECTHAFRFSVCGFCETSRLFESKRPEKALLGLKIWHLLHAGTRHSQADQGRNCAMPYAIVLFTDAMHAREINLPVNAPLRRFIAENQA